MGVRFYDRDLEEIEAEQAAKKRCLWMCPDCSALVPSDPELIEKHKEWCGRVVRDMGQKRY